jgi:hypothetical protein
VSTDRADQLATFVDRDAVTGAVLGGGIGESLDLIDQAFDSADPAAQDRRR